MKKRGISSNDLGRHLQRDHEKTFEKTSRFHDILTNLRWEGKASLGKNLKHVSEILNFFNEELAKHVGIEERVVYSFLKIHVPKLEPVIHLLQADHENFRRNLRSFEFSFRKLSKERDPVKRGEMIEKLNAAGTYLSYLLRNHLQAEKESVYKMIERELRPEEKRKLAREIKERKREIHFRHG